MDYDVVVVGAGPAGSRAASFATKAGLRVLLLEKRQQVGFPVRCAEAVGRPGFIAELGEDRELFPDGAEGNPDERFLAAFLNGGELVSPSGKAAYIAKPCAGYVLERKVFDKYLAEEAARAGAELWVKAQALGAEKTDDGWRVSIRRGGKEQTVATRVLIGADGVEGLVGRWCGLTKSLPLGQVHSCAQVLLAGLDETVKSDTVYFYLGSTVAPGGYAWLFPKGEGLGNVGLGILGNEPKEQAHEYLTRFVEKHYPGASVLEEIHGCVPATPYPERLVGDGVLLAGDAARQVDPFSGAGINWSLEAGRLAGETVAAVLGEGLEPTAERLSDYEKRWRKRHRKEHQRLYKTQELLGGLNDEEIEKAVAALAAGAKEGELGDISPAKMLGYIIRKAPGLLWKMRRLL